MNLPSPSFRRHLGQLIGVSPDFLISPITGLVIPKFEVDLVNGNKKKRVQVGFDSGMTGAHIEVPASLARELGIIKTGVEQFVDASGVSYSSIGKIDWIGVAADQGCGVRSGKVIFHEGAPLLIGNDFIRDIGASIKYGSSGPALSCSSGEVNPGLHVPMFRISITNGGKVLNAEALFDTGWEGADLALPWTMAEELGLVVTGTTRARTHTGVVTYSQAKADRLGLRDFGECYINGAVVDIHPRGSSLNKVIVGETFFEKTSGMLGYDEDGAFYSCRGGEVRATRRSWIPLDDLTHEIQSDPGLVVVGAGLVVVGVLAWMVFKKN